MRFPFLHRLLGDEAGLSAVEYAFLCCMIVLAMVTGLFSLGNEVKLMWNDVSTQTTSAVSQAAG